MLPLRTQSILATVAFLLAVTSAYPQARTLSVSPIRFQPAQEQRVALVIGNSAYADAPLRNPVNDARALAGELRRIGFKVTLLEDADLPKMFAAIRGFGDELRAGGVGLFYYAGHGVQMRGRNYLIPVGAQIEREDEVVYRSLDAGQVLNKMETAGNRVNIVILDACRNNPFARSFRSMSSGLAVMEAPVNTLIAFATGSFWGVYAVSLPIVVPLAQSMGVSLPLSIGAVVSAGAFGSNACFYGDTTVLSAQASGCNLFAHAWTLVPYSVLAAAVSTAVYVALGYLL